MRTRHLRVRNLRGPCAPLAVSTAASMAWLMVHEKGAQVAIDSTHRARLASAENTLTCAVLQTECRACESGRFQPNGGGTDCIDVAMGHGLGASNLAYAEKSYTANTHTGLGHTLEFASE